MKRKANVQRHFHKASALLLAAAAPALAIDKDWLVQDGTWAVNTNWSPIGVANGGHSVFIGNTAGAFNGYVTLDADAAAANLSLTDGMQLLTNTHAMTVNGNTSISGRNVTPGQVVYYSRITVQDGPNAADFRTNNLTVTNQARFWIDGGVARVDGLFDLQADSFFDGNGVLNLHGNGAVALRNNGRFSLDAGGMTINQNGTGRIDLDGTLADNGLIQLTQATLDGTPYASLTINGDGLADSYDERFWIGGGNSLTMNLAEGWTQGNGGNIEFLPNLAGGDFVARVNGATVTLQGNIDVYTNSYGRFNAPAIVEGTAFVSANGTLEFNNSTTVDGASMTLADGSLVHFDEATTVINGNFASDTPGDYNGNVAFAGPTDWRGTVTLTDTGSTHHGQQTVSLATVINAARADLDGGISDPTNWTVNAPFTVNAQWLDTNDNHFDDTMTINGTSIVAPAYVQMNTDSNYWAADGTLNVNGPGAGLIAQTVRGDDLIVSGALNVSGGNAFSAQTHFDAPGLTTISAGGTLRLDGGSIADPNTIDGGRITGAGTLRASGDHALVGNGTIATNVTFSGASELRAKDGSLIVTGTVTDVGVIGTADATGLLTMANAWNTNVADRVELLGGQLNGAPLTNGGTLTGRGFVTPFTIFNNGTISAVGGTLVLDAIANDIHLSGAGSGQVRAIEGNVFVQDIPQTFNGSATVGAGRTMTLNNGWTVGSNATVDLSGTVGSPATIAGPAQTFNGTAIVNGHGVFDIDTNFTATASVQTAGAGDSLMLLKGGFVNNGASFSGPGELRNAGAATLTLDNASTVGVKLVQSGDLEIESPTAQGIASVQRLQQTKVGATHLDLAGPVPGTQFDRINVTTTATLDGALDLDVVNSYDPAYLFAHEIIRADSISGYFDTVPSNKIGLNKYWAVTYDDDSVFATAAIPGDANLDGSVNITDFAILASQFNTAGPWVEGNFNGDALADINDFAMLAANFNSTVLGDLPHGAAVPESTWLTYSLLPVAMVVRRKRRRS